MLLGVGGEPVVRQRAGVVSPVAEEMIERSGGDTHPPADLGLFDAPCHPRRGCRDRPEVGVAGCGGCHLSYVIRRGGGSLNHGGAVQGLPDQHLRGRHHGVHRNQVGAVPFSGPVQEPSSNIRRTKRLMSERISALTGRIPISRCPDSSVFFRPWGPVSAGGWGSVRYCVSTPS